MVMVVNGVGYDALANVYDSGGVGSGSMVYVALIGCRGFFGIGRVDKEDFVCLFDDRGRLVSKDSGEVVGDKIRRRFAEWGALSSVRD